MMKSMLTQNVLHSFQKKVLYQIHEASAVIFERKIETNEANEIELLLKDENFTDLKWTENPTKLKFLLEEKLALYPILRQNIVEWIKIFCFTTESERVKFLLSVVSSDMCRKFHTDVVDFRLLCTFQGMGTYYILPEDAHFKTENPPENIIQTLPLGAVMLFRGALSATEDYPALLHKSPPAQALGIKRLLLRLDTDTNYW